MTNREVIDRAFDKQIKKAENALNKAGILMTDEAKAILAQNKKYVTRGVFKGIYKTVVTQPGKMILTFGNNTRSKSGFPYAAAVETGRKAGKMPPIRDIKDWLYERARVHGEMRFNKSAKQSFLVKKKPSKLGSLSAVMNFDRQMTTIAFLIARKIGKTGTKPFPFMRPAYDFGVKKFLEIMNND